MHLLKWVLRACGIICLTVAPAAFAEHANGASAVRFPDFAGRDRQFAYLKTRILAAIRDGANFAGHYTIVTIGCGTGCTNNLLVDRKTGAVSTVPYGGEKQQQLTLRHRLSSNMLVVTWFDGDLCVIQEARWNGTAFEIWDSPTGRPDAVCLS